MLAPMGGGGGGRIAVHSQWSLHASFPGYGSVAQGGSGAQAGAPGTVGFFYIGDNYYFENLDVYQYFVTDPETTLNEVEVRSQATLLLGSDTQLNYLLLDEGGHVGVFPGATNAAVWEFLVGTNVSNTLPPGLIGGGDFWLLNLEVSSGYFQIDPGTHLHVLGLLHVGSNGALVAVGDPRGSVVSAWGGPGIWITASNIAVDTGGAILADSQGYRQGYDDWGRGPGAHDLIGGGAHGGQGSDGGQTYGSPTQPILYGSSGGGKYVDGWDAGMGGAGGGAIRLEVLDSLRVNGRISADGGSGLVSIGTGASYKDGGGAGGSIWVETDKLAGTGGLSAVGGPGAVNCGGGGRIAVYYRDGVGFSGWTNATVRGGAAGAVRGASGTLGFFDTSGGTNHYQLFVPLDRFSYDINPLVDTFPKYTNVALGAIRVGMPGVLLLDSPFGPPAWTNGLLEMSQPHLRTGGLLAPVFLANSTKNKS